jgi:hypothetical protein
MKKRGYAATYLPDDYEISDKTHLSAANFLGGGNTDEATEKLNVGDMVSTHDGVRFGLVKASEGPRIRVEFGYMENELWWPTNTETLLASHVKKVDKFPMDKKVAASNWLGEVLNIKKRGDVNG